MNKIVIVINGKAEVGKDTLCDFIIKNYNAEKISSITPFLKIALNNGWDGKKNKKSRKLLSDLKRAFIDFNNLPTVYLLDEYKKFISSDKNILFVHIRESDQIQDFINQLDDSCVFATLLVSNRKIIKPNYFGNDSDDYVDNYPYDFQYNNVKSLDEAEDDFMIFFEKLLHAKGVTICKKQ